MTPSTRPSHHLPHGLPPLQPAVVVNLLDMLAGSQTVPAEVVKICDSDPSLAAWLLESHARRSGRGRLPMLAESLEQIRVASLKTLAVQEAVRLLAETNPPAGREAAWQRALHCARLCRAFAQALAYPTPHEAYLAGLLHAIGQDQDTGAWQADLSREGDAAWAEMVESWQYQSFLADALRYQHWPAESLHDASSLVQILWAARSLVEDIDSNGHLAALLGLPRERIAELHAQAGAEAENLHEEISGLQLSTGSSTVSERLMRALTRYAALEHLMDTLSGCDTEAQAISSIGRHLMEVHGLMHPLYFSHDPAAGKLVARPMPGLCELDLAVPLDTSNAVMALAFRRGMPVAIWRGTGSPVPSLLDEQIARLAHADGLIAIPLGHGENRGVLLACGEQGRLSGLIEDPGYLGRLGELATRLSGDAAKAGQEGGDDAPLAQWRTQTRRIAHEINNPLGIIKNYLALMRMKMGDDNTAQDDLRVINEELDRIGGIVQSLVTEGSTVLSAISEIDINSLLGDLVKVAAPGLMSTKQISMKLELDPQLPKAQADRDKLKQLLINLLLNAIEASPEQGGVQLETHFTVDHNQNQLIEILVSNRGEPIPAEKMATLFEPVVTHKGGAHAGLGLSIVRSLATDLGASVACRSRPQQTTFQLLLPIG